MFHKNFSFLQRELNEKNVLVKNVTADRSTEWCSIDQSKNIGIDKLTPKTVLKNKPYPSKRSENWNFSADNSLKENLSAADTLQDDGSWTRRSVYI